MRRASQQEALKKARLQYGLTKDTIFPEVMVYDPKTKADTLLSNFFIRGRKTIIVRQPGFTPPGYWGETHNLDTWKSNPGAAGCGAQADGWIREYENFQNAGFAVILLTSEKTPDEWEQMLAAKKLTFPAVSLTARSIATSNQMESDLNFKNPSFLFEGRTILPRAYWIVEADGTIVDFQDRSDLKPEESGSDAGRVLQTLTTQSTSTPRLH